jgi:hypothetical protein
MNENILKEFYIGRKVFLEPVSFEKEHTDNLLETLTLLETEFTINTVWFNNDNLLFFHLNNVNTQFTINLNEVKNIDFITVYNINNEKQKFKLFLDKNDNLKLYQNLHYPILISQKEKELENLKTKLLTINN